MCHIVPERLITIGLNIHVTNDDEAFAAAYGHVSHPFPRQQGHTITVRAADQFGGKAAKIREA